MIFAMVSLCEKLVKSCGVAEAAGPQLSGVVTNRVETMMHILLLSLLGISSCLGINDEGRLVTNLLREATPLVRPVANSADALEVRHGLSIQAFEVDEERDRLVLSAWPMLMWKDAGMVWEPSDYGGVTSVHIPPRLMYTPDVIMYNQESPTQSMFEDADVVVQSDGDVFYVPPQKIMAGCSLQEDADEHHCNLKFGSWTYDGSKLNLTLSTDSANLDYYLPNPDWDIVSAEAERHVMRYECCPEPYIDVTYQLHLRRKR